MSERRTLLIQRQADLSVPTVQNFPEEVHRMYALLSNWPWIRVCCNLSNILTAPCLYHKQDTTQKIISHSTRKEKNT